MVRPRQRPRRRRAAKERDEIASSHGRSSSSWAPHITTPVERKPLLCTTAKLTDEWRVGVIIARPVSSRARQLYPQLRTTLIADITGGSTIDGQRAASLQAGGKGQRQNEAVLVRLFRPPHSVHPVRERGRRREAELARAQGAREVNGARLSLLTMFEGGSA